MPAPDFLQACLAQPLPESLALSLPFQDKTWNCVVLSSCLSFHPHGRRFASLLEAALQAAQSCCKFLHFPLVICSEMHLEFTKLVSSPSFLHSQLSLMGVFVQEHPIISYSKTSSLWQGPMKWSHNGHVLVLLHNSTSSITHSYQQETTGQCKFYNYCIANTWHFFWGRKESQPSNHVTIDCSS